MNWGQCIWTTPCSEDGAPTCCWHSLWPWASVSHLYAALTGTANALQHRCKHCIFTKLLTQLYQTGFCHFTGSNRRPRTVSVPLQQCPTMCDGHPFLVHSNTGRGQGPEAEAPFCSVLHSRCSGHLSHRPSPAGTLHLGRAIFVISPQNYCSTSSLTKRDGNYYNSRLLPSNKLRAAERCWGCVT